jgi:hypothetical protein
MMLNLKKQKPAKPTKTKTLADLRGIIKNVDFSDEEIMAVKYRPQDRNGF